MDRFLFADGEYICLYNDGKIVRRHSGFIQNYKEASLGLERAKNWKHSGEGAQFRGDVIAPQTEEENFVGNVNGVHFTGESAEVVYSFTVGGTSGIYKVNLDDEKAPEVHVINSVDYSFTGGCLDAEAGVLATRIDGGRGVSDIALFDMKSGDYKTVTDGDTLDDDPFVSPDDGNTIYFTSRGIGRDSGGAFAGYSNSAVCKLDLSAMDIGEVLASEKYNYIKPVFHGGRLYVIKTPAKEKGANPLLEIILIPFRIIQAIANFINLFVTAFTGKSLASGGDNPAKGRNYDGRKEYVKGNLINAEKEMKKNRKKEKGDYGFIPLSWQLIEAESGKVIKSGVGDYDILSDGTFIVTNGRRIFAVKDGKSKKLCDTEKCLRVTALHRSGKKTDLFEL